MLLISFNLCVRLRFANRSFGNASVNDRVVFVALIRHDLYEGGLNCLLLINEEYFARLAVSF